MSLRASALDDLVAWQPADPRQRALRAAFITHLEARADGLARTCAPAHVTASAAIVDPVRRRLLLVLHRKVGRWLQPGGHCESTDPTLGSAALREATEESGVPGLQLVPGILQVDRHPAPCQPGVVDEHLDVRYLVVAQADAVPVVSNESDDARWFGWDELPDALEPTILEMLVFARERLGSAPASG
jgi:8-oxo-dGTP pyrophosphatase MutT (NUDIX family)